MDGIDAIKEIGEYLALNGIYGWFPTTRTAPWDGILEAVNSIVIASRQQSSAEARILGVHVEGPFLNPGFSWIATSRIHYQSSLHFKRLKNL